METRPSRPQRNRRHSRRAWPPEDDIQHPRPAKRLFTPEIKRMLKDWLIRRRENPYPSRDEKKRLAIDTGLTYTQICNWFANWRRKLKNSERERAKKSWGHLIKHYNTNARGNVEQFSISSEDSIWEEEQHQLQHGGGLRTDEDDEYDDDDDEEEDEYYDEAYRNDVEYSESENDSLERDRRQKECNPPMIPYYANAPKMYMEAVKMEHSNYYPGESGVNTTAQCYQISSTTPEYEYEQVMSTNNKLGEVIIQKKQQQYSQQPHPQHQEAQKQITFSPNKAKYKQQMMEKYLRDTTSECNSKEVATLSAHGSDTALSKWLESAAKFTPNKNNYFIEWHKQSNKLEQKQRGARPIHRTDIMPEMIVVQQSQPQQHEVKILQQQQQQQEQHIYETIHQKDELDAAEALANLAFNCRQRMLNTNAFQTHTNNAIPSS